MLGNFCDWLVYQVLGMPQGSHLSGVVHFFIYDTIKILLLLYGMISVIGVLRTFISQERIKQWMVEKGAMGHFYASLFGAITPFCSCSSIPMFLSFLKMGIPLGVTFSFLVTSPLINEYLVVIMLGLFGWKITLAYVLSGLLMGTVTGIVIGKMKLERYIVEDMFVGGCAEKSAFDIKSPSWKQRIVFGIGEATSIVRKIWVWILVGVALGAFIHDYVPQETIQSVIKGTGIFSVPLATLLGAPMYGSCAAIVPIALALFQKGIPLGTALSFMMAVSALSLPEAVMLRRAMKLPLIVIFFGIVVVGIIIIGYAFNFLQGILV